MMPGVELERLLSRGEELLEAGDTARARECFQQLLGKDPTSVRAHHGIGLCLEAEDREAEALATYVEALQQASDDPGLNFSAGSLCHRLGLADDAADHYARVLARVPDHRLALANSGALHLTEGRLPDARAVLEQALQLEPNDPDVRLNLAQAFARAGDHEAVERCLADGVERLPSNVEIRYRLGCIQAARGVPAEARASFLAVLALAPKSFEAHYRLGQLELAVGNPDHARQWLEVACRLQPGSAAAWNELGSAWMALDETAAARTCFEQALAKDPECAPARANLGRLPRTAS